MRTHTHTHLIDFSRWDVEVLGEGVRRGEGKACGVGDRAGGAVAAVGLGMRKGGGGVVDGGGDGVVFL